MVTFSDMNTLLLTFFVFLITTMTIDIKKFNLVISAFQGAVGVLEQGRSINLTNEELMNMGTTTAKLGQSDDIVRPRQEVQQILGWIQQNLQEANAMVEVSERGMKVLLTDKAIFDVGSDEVKPEGAELLGRIAFFLNTIVPGDDFRIEGHTDDRPLEGGRRFRSNLDLSAARAARVYENFQRQGIRKERMSIAGYGEARPLPRKPDEDEETWRGRCRRVEIAVIWSEKAE